jgi:hypothetical protein
MTQEKPMAKRRIGLLPLFLLASCAGEIMEGAQEPDGGRTVMLPTGGTGGGGMGGAGGAIVGGTGGTVMRGPDGGTVTAACVKSGPQPGFAGMRRLTRAEYDNTILELLGDNSSPAANFPRETLMLGFDNNAQAALVSGLQAEQYELSASALATKAAQNPLSLMGCTAGEAEDACATRFIGSFGLRALRRPLAPDEQARYATFYTTQKAKYGFATAVRLLVQTFLQSPYFIYHVETSTPPTGATSVRLTAHEIASRLSYLIWASMPDKPLFAAAANGELATADGIAKQARRMLQDTRSGRGMANIFSQWLDTPKVESAAKDKTLFPKWNATLGIGRLLRQETETFIQNVLANEGTIEALLRAPYTYLNKELATFYGVTGPTGPAFQKVMVDPTKRGGFLTQGAFLAGHGSFNRSSPVDRGVYILERLLCSPPPPPPDDVNTELPDADPTKTARDFLAAHSTEPRCSGCHRLMDPPGLVFEHYDSSGLWRDTDAGRPVDATGEMIGTLDVNGPFDGALQLSQKLAGSAQVRTCVIQQHFRYAYGRGEQEVDTCTLDQLRNSFTATGGNIRELVVALTQTDPFLYQGVDTGGSL